MAGSRSGSLAQGPPPIHPSLLHGTPFLKWTDQDSKYVPVIARVESSGFFLHYFDKENRDTVHTVDLCQIRDVRTGPLANSPRNDKLKESLNIGGQEEKTITIVYGRDFVNVNFLNFCSKTTEETKTWCRELWNHVQLINPLSICANKSLRKLHTQLSLLTNEDKNLPSKAVVKFFAQNKDDRRKIESALDSIGLPSGKGGEIPKADFTFEKFQEFYKSALSDQPTEKVRNLPAVRPEVARVFKVFTSGERMESKEFLTFLNKEQRDPRLNEILHPYATEEKAVSLIHKYEPDQYLVSKNQLSVDGFMWFLMSDDNLVMSREHLLKTDNMEQPLSHYYIKSSHNTYLNGHQITGQSSVEMYRQVLLSGCRCIELDLWNGGNADGGEPMITHGYTMVKSISAKEVIQAIAECAFRTSDYPLILSFENHCSPKQQAKIAEYCKVYFGDRLLQEPLLSHPLDKGQPLPSPEQLKGKILIKNKKLGKHHQHHHPENDLEMSSSLPVADPFPGSAEDSSDASGSESEDDDDSPDSQQSAQGGSLGVTSSDAGTAGKESKASAEISVLVNYIMPVHFRSFEQSAKRNYAFEMSSFVESRALKILKKDPMGIDSYNFMPQLFWNAGCQMVALNYQQLDVPMQLNLGIFQYNRRIGYRLKPEFMTRNDRVFDPFTYTAVDGIVAGTVSIQILSGQFLSDSDKGIYVEVEMYGLPRDTFHRKTAYRTKTIRNGIGPVFEGPLPSSKEGEGGKEGEGAKEGEGGPFVFKQVILPDLALIRLAAFEDGGGGRKQETASKGKLIGQRVLPVLGLCPGYRHIPLFNEVGQPLHLPCLFVHITVGDYIPKESKDIADALSDPILWHKKKEQEQKERDDQLLIMSGDGPEPEEECMRGTEGSPPECGSPSSAKSPVENLRRTASRPLTGKDGPQRTDSAKSLALSMKEHEVVTEGGRLGGGLEAVELVPETAITILEHKSVKEKQSEVNSKLEQMRKKKRKDLGKLQDKLLRTPSKPKNPLAGFKKKFSTPSMDSPPSSSPASTEEERRGQCEKKLSCETQYLRQERELKDKYLDSMFECATKVMTKSQSSQLKSLEAMQKREEEQVMKNIEQESKTEEQAGVSADEQKRERANKLVKRGVTERRKLEDMYDSRRAVLEAAHEKVKKDLQDEKEARKKQQREQHDLMERQLRADHS